MKRMTKAQLTAVCRRNGQFVVHRSKSSNLDVRRKFQELSDSEVSKIYLAGQNSFCFIYKYKEAQKLSDPTS